MGDEMSPIMSAPPPSIEGERNPAAQMALALGVLGMLLAVNSVLTDAWLVEEAENSLSIMVVQRGVFLFRYVSYHHHHVGEECGPST